MNNDQDDLRPSDAPLDALLNERLGKDKAPDLTRIVANRHARNEGAGVAALLDEQEDKVTRGNNRPLLTAAMVLLGSAAVVGTVWSVQNQDTANSSRTAQQPEQVQPEQLQPEQVGIEVPPEAVPDPDTQDPQPQDQRPQPPKPQEPEGKLAISVKVVDQNGGPVQDFEVEVHYARGKPPRKVGIKAAIPRQKRHPRDFDGDYTIIKGLKPGTYVVTVEDKLHAPSDSSPFKIPEGDKPPEVVVKLDKGGTIRGSVIDANGQPVAGAAVRVASKDDGKIGLLLTGKPVRLKVPAKVRSNRDGSFELKRLKPGKYRVEVAHDEFSTSRTHEIEIANQAKQTVNVTLKRGALIVGRVTKRGRPQNNFEVRISELTKEKKFATAITTRTDAEGRFAFDQRIAPGRYRIQTMSGAKGGENPFEKLLQLKDSQRDIEIKAGERKLEHNIDLK